MPGAGEESTGLLRRAIAVPFCQLAHDWGRQAQELVAFAILAGAGLEEALHGQGLGGIAGGNYRGRNGLGEVVVWHGRGFVGGNGQ